jgi:hypothetical protein
MLFDFTENSDPSKKNFQILDPSQFSILERPIEGIAQKPTLVFPYPQRYGGTVDDDAKFESKEEGMQAFDIKTSSQSEVEAYMAK